MAIGLKFPKIGGKKQSFARAHSRYTCYMPARLNIVDSRLVLDGMIFEISQGGVLFRQASQYILDRLNSDVRVELPGMSIKGLIVNVRPIGYGIKLFEQFEEEDVMLLAQEFAKPPFKWKEAN